METKVNYTIVGFFVTALSIAFVIGVLWLSVGLSGKKYNEYAVYIKESVSGLAIKAPVKFNGMEVGYVSEMLIPKDNPSQVYVLLDIDSAIPISTDTVAQLDSQGLTGIAYIELEGGKPDAPLLEAQPGEAYPVITTKPSLFYRLDATIEHISKSFDKISEAFNTLVTKENGQTLTRILNQMEQVTNVLSKNSESFDTIINDTKVILANTSKASVKISSVLDNINRTSNTVDEFASSWTIVGSAAQQTLTNTTVTMQGMNDQVMPDFMETMSEARDVIRSLKSLTNEIEQNPGVILRGKAQEKLGPGES